MDPNLFYKHTQREPLAPVDGGLRWRRPCHDIVDLCRGRGFTITEPDAPPETAAPRQEPGVALAPHIASTPPPEARVGAAYVYAARAHDGITDGFTWSIHQGPPGMAVDRYSGKVLWTPAAGGYVEIVLCARSVYGKMARQRWTVCVRKAAAVRVFTPNPRFQKALRRKTSRIMPFPMDSFRFGVPFALPRPPKGGEGGARGKLLHGTFWCSLRYPTGPPGTRLRVAFPLRV